MGYVHSLAGQQSGCGGEANLNKIPGFSLAKGKHRSKGDYKLGWQQTRSDWGCVGVNSLSMMSGGQRHSLWVEPLRGPCLLRLLSTIVTVYNNQC